MAVSTRTALEVGAASGAPAPPGCRTPTERDKNVGNLKKVLDNFSARISESAASSCKRPLTDRQRLVEAVTRRKASTEMVRAVWSGLRAFQRGSKRPW